VDVINVLYEHPEWFKPLFAELDRRGLRYVQLDATRLTFDPSTLETDGALVLNRMSPSAYLRGHTRAIFATLHYLAYLKEVGVPAVNGYDAFRVEISKAAQLNLLQKLGLRHPKARVINDPAPPRGPRSRASASSPTSLPSAWSARRWRLRWRRTSTLEGSSTW
jgi:hypothetical protein